MYMPYIKDRFGIEIICPICHVSTVNEDQDVGEIIEAGKEITLKHCQDQNWFSKKSLLRDLKKLGFKDLAIYLQTMAT